MASVTNKALSTGSVTNREFAGLNLTWDEATFTWDDAGVRTWDIPVDFRNKAINTGSMTNKPISA